MESNDIPTDAEAGEEVPAQYVSDATAAEHIKHLRFVHLSLVAICIGYLLALLPGTEDARQALRSLEIIEGVLPRFEDMIYRTVAEDVEGPYERVCLKATIMDPQTRAIQATHEIQEVVRESTPVSRELLQWYDDVTSGLIDQEKRHTLGEFRRLWNELQSGRCRLTDDSWVVHSAMMETVLVGGTVRECETVPKNQSLARPTLRGYSVGVQRPERHLSIPSGGRTFLRLGTAKGPNNQVEPIKAARRCNIESYMPLLKELIPGQPHYAPFGDMFPRLEEAIARARTSDHRTLRVFLEREVDLKADPLSIGGLKIRRELLAGFIGWLILIGVQIYFALHLNALLELRIAPRSEAWLVPWIGLYRGGTELVILVASFVPLAAVVYSQSKSKLTLLSAALAVCIAATSMWTAVSGVKLAQRLRTRRVEIAPQRTPSEPG